MIPTVHHEGPSLLCELSRFSKSLRNKQWQAEDVDINSFTDNEPSSSSNQKSSMPSMPSVSVLSVPAAQGSASASAHPQRAWLNSTVSICQTGVFTVCNIMKLRNYLRKWERVGWDRRVNPGVLGWSALCRLAPQTKNQGGPPCVITAPIVHALLQPHRAGVCDPCVFFNSARGCRAGRTCPFWSLVMQKAFAR